MRKFLFFSTVFVFAMIAESLLKDDVQKIVLQKKMQSTEKFETYTKTSRRINSRKSSQKEIRYFAKRSVASAKNKFPKRGDRLLIGNYGKRFQDSNVPLELLNNYNPRWKDQLSKDLLKYFPQGTKAIIKRKAGMIKITQDKGRLLEKALISINLPNGNYSSYHALVDSHSGKVVHTWDQTRHEKKASPLKINPTGNLK